MEGRIGEVGLVIYSNVKDPVKCGNN